MSKKTVHWPPFSNVTNVQSNPNNVLEPTTPTPTNFLLKRKPTLSALSKKTRSKKLNPSRTIKLVRNGTPIYEIKTNSQNIKLVINGTQVFENKTNVSETVNNVSETVPNVSATVPNVSAHVPIVEKKKILEFDYNKSLFRNKMIPKKHTEYKYKDRDGIFYKLGKFIMFYCKDNDKDKSTFYICIRFQYGQFYTGLFRKPNDTILPKVHKDFLDYINKYKIKNFNVLFNKIYFYNPKLDSNIGFYSNERYTHII